MKIQAFCFKSPMIAAAVLCQCAFVSFAQAQTYINTLTVITNEMDQMRLHMPVPHLEKSQDGRKFPRLWLGSIRWEQPVDTDEENFSVDQGLSPIVTKKFNFQLLPQLRTPENDVRSLNAGYYVLRMVILRPEIEGDRSPQDIDNSQSLYRRYVSGTERIVRMDDGSIRAQVRFQIHSISATNMRNSLLIQILPVKPESLKRNKRGLVLENSDYELAQTQNYLSSVVRIPFVPRLGSGLATPPSTVTENDMNIEEETLDLGLFQKNAEKILRMEKRALQRPQDPAQTAKTLQLEYRKLDDPRLARALGQLNHNNTPRLTREQLAFEIENITQDRPLITEESAASFCRILVAESKLNKSFVSLAQRQALIANEMLRHMFSRCARRPQEHFTLTRQIHVRQIGEEKNDAQYVQGTPMMMTLNSNFGANRSASLDTSRSWAAGFSSLISPLDMKGILRLGYTYTIAENQSRSRFEGTMTLNSMVLETNQWVMQFRIKAYTPCLAVVPRREGKAWSMASDVPGFYLCGETREDRPILAKEHYYHVFPSAMNSPTLNFLHPKNQPVNMVLRGQRDYLAFVSSIRRLIQPVHNKERDISIELRNAAALYSASTPTLPTVLAYNVQLDGPRTTQRLAIQTKPGFLDHALGRFQEKFD